MDHYVIILFIMALMLFVSALANKAKLPVPIVLILAGMLIGFVPNMPLIELNPEIIMLIFLPPLLYDAAFNISFGTFKTNINTIATLATALVFITACGIAVIAHYLIPGMTWPLSFALGAILSATDAVAAVGITKGLGLPHNVITILEGESLINDASSLVAYRFAIASVSGAAFIWWQASLSFLLVLLGGFVIGLALSKLLAIALRSFRKDNLFIISLMLLMPFVTYSIAEHFEVSGVVAAVTLGLGMAKLTREKFPENLKSQSRNLWDIIIYILNGLIFVLIGLQFPIVMKHIPTVDLLPYIGYALIITLATFIIRLIRVFWQQFGLKKAYQGKRKVKEEALFDTKTSMIIAWSGMRGIVSLAIAMGLPLTLKSGAPFPMRSEIIFISIAVVLFSLIGQGLTLPWLLKTLKKSDAKQISINGNLP